MPVIAGISAGLTAIGSGVQAIQSADAAGNMQKLQKEQNDQQQAMIAEAKNQQAEQLRQKALSAQRDEMMASSQATAAWRANYAMTLFTGPGGVSGGNTNPQKTILGG